MVIRDNLFWTKWVDKIPLQVRKAKRQQALNNQSHLINDSIGSNHKVNMVLNRLFFRIQGQIFCIVLNKCNSLLNFFKIIVNIYILELKGALLINVIFLLMTCYRFFIKHNLMFKNFNGQILDIFLV